MAFVSRIKDKIKSRKHELEASGQKVTTLSFLFLLINAAINMMLARIYLRKVNELGSMVSVNKKPQLVNKGTIRFANEVRVWSNINKAKIFVDPGAELTVGTNSRLNGCHISVSSKVQIGNNVRIAPYSIIIDNDFHKVDDHFSDEGTRKPIIIDDNVWITMNCMIMKGVHIGEGSVVASGAVVTKDVPPHCVVAGVPAKIIKQLKA